MYWSPQRKMTTNIKQMHQTAEIAELTIISEGNVIRRMQLNNITVATELDTCSIVSVLTNDRLESKIMMITERTEVKPLGHAHPGNPSCGLELLQEIHQEKRRPHYTVTSSDDPRRGGKRSLQRTTAPKKEYGDSLRMDPAGAMSPATSKIREE